MPDKEAATSPLPLSRRTGSACPSARCSEEAVVLGIIDSSGKVGYISPALPVNAEFIDVVRRNGSPETRFRFSAPCQEIRCENWVGGRCSVIDDALVVAGNSDEFRESVRSDLPRCAIRRFCRWFEQSGPNACRICPFLFNHIWPIEYDREHK